MASQPGFTVFFVVALLNFFGSVIQGVAGIGDAIFLQVMWAIAASANKAFEKTPLGTESVKVVALIMYIRLLFMSPLIVYLGLSDSIFSKQMVIMMAIPSTILSVVGVWLLPYAPDKLLKQLLAYSSFFFAFVYGCILVKNQYLKSSQLAKIKEKNIVITEESDAIKKEAQMAQDPGLMSMHASFVMNTPRGDILSNRGGKGNNDNHNSALNVSQSGMNSSQQLSNGSIIIQHVAQERSSQLQNSFTFPRNNRSFVSGHFSNNNYAGSVTTIDPDTGLQEGTTEAFMSTTGGGIFSADEARIPHPTEDNAPPLSPGKLSPLATLTYTRVRINRNLDENGKIKMTTKIGAAVAASVAGIMTSLTGVNAPPQIIFILLFDAPNYIVRVNFSAQSIPSNVLRFILGIPNGLFSWDQIPLFLDVVVFGFAGVVVGNHVGRMLGPNAFNYFVLCLLLLSALSMVTKNLYFLVPCVVFTAVTTVGFAYYENKQSKAKVDEQRVQELEIEQRVYDVYEDLIRNNNSFVGPGVLQGARGPLQPGVQPQQ
ncbi:hypothetical protein AGDE_02019 [Angomonas deanei]|uniref:Sulfite exporter TauE/SafE, putative n=1 Tax=Angomonas deanei TaxID=59799 RepID=A0A7G2CG42_9TRYP|nr:hypothetical protein AGDE_02019 [Angomonas deanei]CAD2217673.1 Sulfite exporter TauE/SafE, putative [Angomonas deanei]|eukprot:EPY41904.1 hypothetical protein AGDE_02019 [Angomonas deanei]